MNRNTFAELWNESWDQDTWIAPWSKALASLTPQQASWTPLPGRHSIWQIVNHVCFWRGVTLAQSAKQPKPSTEECERRNFESPAKSDQQSWDRAQAALKQSHDRFSAALADPNIALDRIKYHLAHDAYHLGQVMQLRALQGLPAIL